VMILKPFPLSMIHESLNSHFFLLLIFGTLHDRFLEIGVSFSFVVYIMKEKQNISKKQINNVHSPQISLPPLRLNLSHLLGVLSLQHSGSIVTRCIK